MSYYKPGSWNCICAVCGREFKSDEVRKRWDGLIVCKSDYEDRHILDFIRVETREHTVPYTSPEPDDVFVKTCAFPASVGMANIGLADCSVVGLVVTPIPYTYRSPAIAGEAISGAFTPAITLIL